MTLSRRDLLRNALGFASAIAIPAPLLACGRSPEERSAAPAGENVVTTPEDQPLAATAASAADQARLRDWVGRLRAENLVGPDASPGAAATRVGELATGTPYEAYTLERYLETGGSPVRTEPLTLHLDRFDCVSLVEACLAVARVAHQPGEPTWEAFAAEMERMRYRGGDRAGYASRLHYFSEWLADNERRGLVRLIGQELGGVADTRPLRFMSTHPDSYPALAVPEVLAEIAAMERRLDSSPRHVIPTERIASIAERIQTGDILAFATSIEGLDVTHAAFAYRPDEGPLRVLHAPLSGGVVEVTDSTVPEYVAAIRRSTGILLARPLWG